MDATATARHVLRRQRFQIPLHTTVASYHVLTLNDGKTTYTTADPWVNYTWTCSPGGAVAGAVYMWLQEPDGTSVLLNYGGGYTQTFGISTSNSYMTTPGTYTLKACFGSTSSCTTAIASQTFTMSAAPLSIGMPPSLNNTVSSLANVLESLQSLILILQKLQGLFR